MTSKKRKLSDDEIEAAVLSDLDDPSAWDDPIHVPASPSRRPAWVTLGRHLELSASFHVLSVLHRLGLEASLTHAHPDNVDVTVVQGSGRAATIDVKTLIGTTTWLVQPFVARKNHYLAFVVFSKNAGEDPGRAPRVVVIPAPRLKTLLAKEKAQRVDVQTLEGALGITDPWRQFIVEAA